jgi:hypothetical protein
MRRVFRVRSRGILLPMSYHSAGPNMRAFLCVCLLPLTLFPANAQKAGGALPLTTGREWLRLSVPEKIAWVAGFYEARLVWEEEVRLNTPGCIDGADIKRGLPCKYPNGTTSSAFSFPRSLTLGEISESLDQFYSEPTNRVIPIFFAFYWVDLKAHGVPEAALKAWESTMRACTADASTCPANGKNQKPVQ